MKATSYGPLMIEVGTTMRSWRMRRSIVLIAVWSSAAGSLGAKGVSPVRSSEATTPSDGCVKRSGCSGLHGNNCSRQGGAVRESFF